MADQKVNLEIQAKTL